MQALPRLNLANSKTVGGATQRAAAQRHPVPPQKPKATKDKCESESAARPQPHLHKYGLATQDGSLTARPPAKPARPLNSRGKNQPHSARPANNKPGWGDLDPKLGCTPPSHPVPVSPQSAQKIYQGRLTEYELSEILDYPQVYHVGSAASKIKFTTPSQPNHGYDDERGDYNMVMHDHIAYRYEILDTLGKGSFGQVLSACCPLSCALLEELPRASAVDETRPRAGGEMLRLQEQLCHRV